MRPLFSSFWLQCASTIQPRPLINHVHWSGQYGILSIIALHGPESGMSWFYWPRHSGCNEFLRCKNGHYSPRVSVSKNHDMPSSGPCKAPFQRSWFTFQKYLPFQVSYHFRNLRMSPFFLSFIKGTLFYSATCIKVCQMDPPKSSLSPPGFQFFQFPECSGNSIYSVPGALWKLNLFSSSYATGNHYSLERERN